MPRFPARVISVAFAFWASMAVVAAAQKASDVEGPEPKNVINEMPTRMADAPAPNANTTKVAPAQRPSHSSATNFLLDFTMDQEALWTSPARLRFKDTTWLVPLSGIAAGLFVTDSDVSRHLSHDPNTLSRYDNISTAGVAGLLGGSAAMWTFSHFNGNPHWRETGFLASEAAVHSLLMTEALKYSLRRERPYQGDGTGPFFQQGGTSFPSEHAAAAWSAASVIAHEYPGPLTKLLAYGAASLVSFSRVRAEKHFPSDVMVGALVGQLAAYEIYKRHHDPQLGGDTWNSPADFFFSDGHSKPGFLGSPYVPLDSWVYPALDRLAAMGLINSAFVGMRPWTRLVCAQMVIEAQDRAEGSDGVAHDLVKELEREFQPELGGGAERGKATLRLESVYSRVEQISGMPLTDGYHFAQTQFNDFGRPYSEGFNSVTGFSAYSTWGPWVGYVRGELQTAPAIPALPLSARQAIASNNMDALPDVPPPLPLAPDTRFDLLEAYAGLTLSNWSLAFGRQSLEWGPGEGGSLGLSNNAPPINMLRINRVTPMEIPLISRFLGPMRTEFFFGQLAGQELVFSSSGSGSLVGHFGVPLNPQPFIHGEKISFKPTRNFEFGFYRTTIYGGPGYPLTWHTFLRSVFSSENKGTYGTSTKPGNRTSELDFSYRLPKLRDWVTFYGEGYTDDQFSPIAYADRSAWRAGLYLSRFPGLTRLDLRLEGVYTDVPPGGGPISPGQFYFNDTWRSGYTNDGDLLGNWVGRGGQGAQAWTNYWFTPKDRVQLSFRHQKVSQEFVPGGGSLTDFGVRGDYWLRSNLGLSASVQYERWLFPVIQPGAEKNVSVSVEIQFQPQKMFSSSMFLLTSRATGKEK